MKHAKFLIVALFLAGCGGASAPPLSSSRAIPDALLHRHPVGLGKILTSRNGQIFGYDIDQGR